MRNDGYGVTLLGEGRASEAARTVAEAREVDVRCTAMRSRPRKSRVAALGLSGTQHPLGRNSDL